MSKCHNIILVDDEVAVHDIFEFFFTEEIESNQMSLAAFANAKDAIKHIESKHGEAPVSCVITDVNMPGLNGFDLLHYVKSEYSDILVVMVTAYGGADFQRKAEVLNADGYFMKPLDFGEFKESLQKILSSK